MLNHNHNHTSIIGKRILPIYLINEYARHVHSICNMVQQTTISFTEILIYLKRDYTIRKIQDILLQEMQESLLQQ